MQVRKEEIKIDDIKELINEISKTYKNFKRYNIIPHEILSDTYDVFLYFDDEDKMLKRNDYITQVYILKNVLKRKIEVLIENVHKDFENLVGIEILPDTDKKHLVHIVLEFNVNSKITKFIPADITTRSWSGGSKLGGCEVGLEICRYKDGRPSAFSQYSLYKEIYITEIYKGILIRIENNPSNYDLMFKIQYEEDNNVYKLIEYGETDREIWMSERKQVREWEVDNISVDEVRKELIKKLERELNICISKRSHEVIDEQLIYITQVSKIKIDKN